MNVSKSLQRKVDREARKCSRTFGRMDILVERTQNIITDVQEQIERAEEERRKKLEEEKKRLNRKNRIENTFKSKMAQMFESIPKSDTKEASGDRNIDKLKT